jgi:hypothetical protein
LQVTIRFRDEVAEVVEFAGLKRKRNARLMSEQQSAGNTGGDPIPGKRRYAIW